MILRGGPPNSHLLFKRPLVDNEFQMPDLQQSRYRESQRKPFLTSENLAVFEILLTAIQSAL
jgi:hypothetical protein